MYLTPSPTQITGYAEKATSDSFFFKLADTRSEGSILEDGDAALRYANVPLTRR